MRIKWTEIKAYGGPQKLDSSIRCESRYSGARKSGGSDGEEFTFPAIAASKGDFIYVANEAVEFNNFFGFPPDYTSSSVFINGDDAIDLVKQNQYRSH